VNLKMLTRTFHLRGKCLRMRKVQTSYLNANMCKFESSYKEVSRRQSADASKACNNPIRAFDCRLTDMKF